MARIMVKAALDANAVARGTTFQFDYEGVSLGATILLRNQIVVLNAETAAEELRHLGSFLLRVDTSDIDLHS